MKNNNSEGGKGAKTTATRLPTTQPLTPKTSFTVTMNRDVWERFKLITPRNKTMVQAVEDLITEKVIKAGVLQSISTKEGSR